MVQQRAEEFKHPLDVVVTPRNMATITETEQMAKDDSIDELPRTIERSSTTIDPSAKQRHRHSKRLSLNFPIAIQISHDAPLTGNGSISSWSQSPTTTSARNSTPTSARPLPSPELQNDELFEGPDFLRLIAGQERKVMELKEELHKAESGLMNLKKQWAVFEARKKHAERNKTLKMGPVSPKSTRAHDQEEEEAERVRRKELREKKLRELASRDDELSRSDSTSGKRNGGRVFAGRHTRTLSLLQNNNPNMADVQSATQIKTRKESSSSSFQQTDENLDEIRKIDEDAKRMSRPAMSRQPTLPELIASGATGAAQINFGKTYKELANAGRKSIPPGADVFVKQGKQVYDGVSQGFWNFVEDIRQATVGDEAVNGPQTEPKREVRQRKSSRKLADGKGGSTDDHKKDKDNFWKEFGLETPQGKKSGSAAAVDKSSKKAQRKSGHILSDHESKSSTDSSNRPPSLLADLMDVKEDDESWDTWLADSPAAQRHTERVEIRHASDDGDEDDSEDDLVQPQRATKTFTAKKNHTPLEPSWAELTT